MIGSRAVFLKGLDMSSYKKHTVAGDFFGTCKQTGKRQYESRKMARRARQAGGHRHGNPYRCSYCDYWHLGRYHAAKTRDQYRKRLAGYIHVNAVQRRLGVSRKALDLAIDHFGIEVVDGHIALHAFHQLQQLTYRKG